MCCNRDADDKFSLELLDRRLGAAAPVPLSVTRQGLFDQTAALGSH